VSGFPGVASLWKAPGEEQEATRPLAEQQASVVEAGSSSQPPRGLHPHQDYRLRRHSDLGYQIELLLGSPHDFQALQLPPVAPSASSGS
jgi:hypothetical protein